MDPYGRAKTVRIGKWRWPPPSDGTSNGVPGDMNGFPSHQSFLQFKMSKQQQIQRHKQSQVSLNHNVWMNLILKQWYYVPITIFRQVSLIYIVQNTFDA